MTASAHLQLTDRILTALRADPPLVDGPIARGRAVAVAKGISSAIGLRLARAAARPLTIHGDLHWQTVVVVECLKRAGDGEDAHSAVDALLQAVYGRVAPLFETGAALSEPEIAWDFEDQDPSVGAASLILRADHSTSRNTLLPKT